MDAETIRSRAAALEEQSRLEALASFQSALAAQADYLREVADRVDQDAHDLGAAT